MRGNDGRLLVVAGNGVRGGAAGERTAIILAVLSVFCFAGMVFAFVGGIAFIGRPKNS